MKQLPEQTSIEYVERCVYIKKSPISCLRCTYIKRSSISCLSFPSQAAVVWWRKHQRGCTCMALWYHQYKILSIRHPQQAYVIPFTAYPPGGSSTAYPLCLLVVCIHLFLEQSPTLPRQASTLNARIWKEIKSINPLPDLVNLSHTVHHSLWPCNSSSLALCLRGSLIL